MILDPRDAWRLVIGYGARYGCSPELAIESLIEDCEIDATCRPLLYARLWRERNTP